MKVKGTFDADLKPLKGYAEGKQGIQLGRMSIDKHYQGDLAATGKGEMLTAMTSTEGSAGYVAIEQVTGELQGKTGSFVLQHFGTMENGSERLILEVVPGSGTGDLTGLSGTMKIIHKGEEKLYEFDAEL